MRDCDRTILRVMVFWGMFFAGWTARVDGQEKIDPVQITLSADNVLVTQNLLSLVHAPEVMDEIGIPRAERGVLEEFLRTVDGEWWRGRIRPAAEHRKTIERLEAKLAQFLNDTFGVHVIKRLRQLEWQSQGVRALVRPEVAGYMQVTTKQFEELELLFTVTEEIRKRAMAKPGQLDEKAAGKLATALEEEPKKVIALLTGAQRERLGKLIGKPFDTSKLKRIFPLAPELVSSEEWVNQPVNVGGAARQSCSASFLCFQCGNCKKNFPIYQRWQRELASSGVQVLGFNHPRHPRSGIRAVRRDAGEWL